MSKYPLGVQVIPMPILIAGARTADANFVGKFVLPFDCLVIAATASARSSSGTSPTLSVQPVFSEGNLGGALSVVAGEDPVGGDLTTPVEVFSGQEMGVNLDIGGTDTPTFNDIMVVLTVVRQ